MMKKIYTSKSVLALAAIGLVSLLLSGCAETENVFFRKPIMLSAGSDYNEVEIATRGAFNIQGPNFDKNEKISAYIIDSNGEYIGNPTTYTTREAENHVNDLDPDVQPYFPVEDGVTVNIYALYPQKVKLTDTEFAVLDNQTHDQHYKESDLMHASLTDLTNTSEKLRLHFTHKMTKVIISTTAAQGITIKNFRLPFIDKKAEFDPRTGKVIKLSGQQGAIEIDSVAGAVVFPEQTITGTFLEVVTTDGKVSTFGLNGKKFEAGRVYTLNVAVDEGNYGKTINIQDWPDEVGTVTMASYNSPGLAVETVDSIEYRPTPAIKPEPEVTYSGNKLTKDKDYTLQYFGNEKVGTATILVAGMGNYAGLAVATSFKIYQAPGKVDIKEDTIEKEYAVNGEVKYTIEIVGDGTRKYESSDESVATIDDKGVVTMQGVGETTIKVTMLGDKNYTSDSDSFVLKVEGKDIENSDIIEVTIDPIEYYYDGTERKPTVTMTEKKDMNKEIVDAKYYTVEYSDNIHKGTGKVLVTGKDKYAGKVEKTFTIKQATTEIDIPTTDVAMKINSTYNGRRATVRHNSNTVSYQTSNPNFGTVVYSCDSDDGKVTVNENGLVTNTFSTDITTDKEVTIKIKVATNEYEDWEEKETSYKIVIPYTRNYAFNGTYNNDGAAAVGTTQSFTAPASGRYLLKVWGARGADTTQDGVTYYGGKGAYIAGTVYLEGNTTLYIYVGGQGLTATSATGSGKKNIGGWNGGGSIVWASASGTFQTTEPMCGGGGATDISLNNGNWDSNSHLYSRIIVAGGGGGALYYARESSTSAGLGAGPGGNGGAFNGGDGVGTDKGYGGKINAGGAAGRMTASAGTFGKGGGYWNIGEGAGMGGGGWYGGGSAGHDGNNGSGGGGSSYIWNAANKDYYPGTKPDVKYYVTEIEKMAGGNEDANGKAEISCYGSE